METVYVRKKENSRTDGGGDKKRSASGSDDGGAPDGEGDRRTREEIESVKGKGLCGVELKT